MRLRFSFLALFVAVTVICVALAVARAFGYGVLYCLAPLYAFGLSPPRTRWLVTAVVVATLLISGWVLYHQELVSVGSVVFFVAFSLIFWSAEIAVYLIIAQLTGEGVRRDNDKDGRLP